MKRAFVAVVLLAILAWGVPAYGQDESRPRILDVRYVIYPYQLGYATSFSFNPSSDVAQELDIIEIEIDVQDADLESDEGEEFYYSKFSFWAPYTPYFTPEPPPVDQDTFDTSPEDTELELDPFPRMTPTGADTATLYLAFLIPEWNGVNQARLRGLIDYDIRWVVSMYVWDEDTGDAAENPIPYFEFLLYAEENAALRPANPRPFADAGADVTVAAGATVNLDGSRTFDSYNLGFNPNDPDVFEKDDLDYIWEQLTGAEVVAPTYPDPDSRPWLAQVTLNVTGTYEYRLAVSDGVNPLPDFDTMVVTVVSQLPTNLQPHGLIVGPSGPVVLGDVVTLDATGSTDPNGDTLTYRWRQVDEVGGELPASEFSEMFQPLGGSQTATASWQAQRVGTYYFLLVVSDGELSDTVAYSVQVVETAEEAAAAQTVVSGGQETSLTSGDGATTTAAGCGGGLLPLAALPLLLWLVRGRIR